MNLLRKLFGNKNDRELRRMRKEVAKVNSHAEAFASLDDGQLRDTTAALKARLASGDVRARAFCIGLFGQRNLGDVVCHWITE